MSDVLIARLDALALKLGPLTVAFDALGDAVSAAVSRFNSAASRLAAIISANLDVQAPPDPLTPGGGTSPTTSPVNPPNSPWTAAQPSPATAPSTQSLGAILTQALAPVVSLLQKIHAAILASTTKAGPPPAQTTPASPSAALASGSPQAAAAQAIAVKTQAQGEAVAKAAVSSPVSVFDSLLGKMMGPLNSIMEAFSGIAAKVTAFVGALNPSAVMQFGAAMRDLQAVIGVALQPVLQGLTEIVRHTANALLPVMQQLAPVMKSLMTTVGEVAKVWVNIFASLLSTLTPALKVVADVFNALAPILQGAYAIFSGLVSAVAGVVRGILSIFGINLTDVTGGLRKAMESLTKHVLLAVASLLKFISTSLGNNFIDGVTRALIGDAQKDARGLAAPQNATISTFQDFGRSVTKAALLAGPDGGKEKKSQEEWLKDVVSNLVQLRNTQGPSLEDMAKTLQAILRVVTFGLVPAPVYDRDAALAGS